MRIHAQLVLLLSAVATPLALLGGASTYALYQTQREVHAQRFLERVRGLRLALDTELSGTIRLLKTFADRDSLSARDAPAPASLDDPLRRILRSNPMWTAVTVVEPDGEAVSALGRSDRPAPPALDAPTREAVLRTRLPVVSDLLASADGTHHYTYTAVPAVANGAVVRIVAACVDQRDWLAFLMSNPIAAGATLTLNDRRGAIIARTLNNDSWVGKPSRPEFWDRAVRHDEAWFVSRGLEGQMFYSAFSHLKVSSWVLGTGVPAATVEADLHWQTLLMLGGTLLALTAAGCVGLALTRRMREALSGIAALSAPDRGAADRHRPLAIPEAESVRQMLQQTLDAEARARAEAEQARELALEVNRGKDEFLATLAHELRNPLSAMASALALLEAAKATPELRTRAREILQRQLAQMTMLVNDMLEAARTNRGDPTLHRDVLDLADLVDKVVESFGRTGRTAHRRVGVMLQSARVNGDAMRLEQVVANLLDNAIKFTGDGGRIDITLIRDGAQAVLTVADDGVGMDAGALPQVFDPYAQVERRVDPTRGSLGLGLHVVKRLVDLHGGTVQARSEGLGRGAAFVVRLAVHGGSRDPDTP